MDFVCPISDDWIIFYVDEKENVAYSIASIAKKCGLSSP